MPAQEQEDLVLALEREQERDRERVGERVGSESILFLRQWPSRNLTR